MTYPVDGEDKGIYKMESQAGKGLVTIALVSDWATDTNESRLIGNRIKDHHPDYTIHMGDTYFVGTPEEVERNFNPNNSPWPFGAVGSFALAGNHEMYSNGNPYFDTLISWMGLFHPERVVQKTSYVCLENDYWRIIGLDTGFRSVGIPFLEPLISKSDLRNEELDWLCDVLNLKDDNKGLIFLTHHQPVSAFSRSYKSTGRQLSKITGAGRKVLWFWGHEHRYAIYGKNSIPDGMSFYGRCIGHGGMPIELEKHPEQISPDEKNLVLYDNRYRVQIGKADLGHNGFALLRIDGATLVIEYYDEQHLLVTEKWRYNQQEQCIEGQAIDVHQEGLELIREVGKAIQ